MLAFAALGCAQPVPAPSTPGIVTATPAPTVTVTAPGPAMDALLQPAETAADWPAQLSEAQMRLVLARAGWSGTELEQALAVAWCESRWSPGAVGDAGGSVGLFQLWTGWFAAFGVPVEQWDDPVVNARVALLVLERRGRWGGGGGWSCAP
ncbi:MAG: hypothetical protein KatS3mg051_2151 [Anaerolineae bacterium]|nr:MAG: hypothetical protein KatS3mg051_1822 [Anaerolineae bacterium]GIV82797.1 MAG: hypothetical protein KatS3mg051_2151 [Anaerolineae bacterium]